MLDAEHLMFALALSFVLLLIGFMYLYDFTENRVILRTNSIGDASLAVIFFILSGITLTISVSTS